ncbi:AraC family transcriptional regulator [Paenibacillus alkalitolerans]|uniref:AraC family transcriptional regulator n=1 Tax=Paenibacillus alkalitolerans TaxID=2799335 RepID=UPI0018F5E12E|nr:AraC family transcriptional regulator [Paenibacillus alkalitolerans]
MTTGSLFDRTDRVTNTLLHHYPVHCVYKDCELRQPDLHLHRGFEFYLCLSGKGTILAEDKVYALLPGSITVISPQSLHLIKPDPNTPLQRIILSVDEPYLLQMLQEDPELEKCANFSRFLTAKSLQWLLTPHGFLTIRDILHHVEKELSERKPYYTVAAKNLLQRLILELGRERHAAGQDNLLPNKTVKIVEEILKFLSSRYQEDINVSEISRRFKVSRSSLYKLFKQITGYSMNQYLISYRMNKAKEQLEQTDLPIIEIAVSVGCHDLSHFCRTFKKLCGATPGEFRLMSRSESEPRPRSFKTK